MKKKLLSLLFALGIFGQFLAASTLSFGAVLPQTVGVFETSLASPISTSATSMTLTANAVRGGTTLSGYNCFTVDQGSAQAEFICGTVSGTSVTALVRGVDPSTGTSTITALQFAHRRGASVKITDFPAVVILRHQLNGSDSIYNLIRYDTNVLIGVGTPTSTLATKYYVDNVVTGGAANGDETTKGLVELATAREAASSTALGGTGAAIVLRSSYATDTPTSGCAVGFTSTAGAGCVPVARLDGKISANFIGTSSSYIYNWGANHTFNASTTFNSTTTLSSTTTINGFTVSKKFGGTGADGALTITSGVTNIDLGGAAEVVKNYTSISITGTGALTFSNPASGGTKIILKSQGNATLTSSAAPMIDASGMGAATSSASSCTSGTSNAGGGGTSPTRLFLFAGGGGGGGPTGGSAGAAGASGATPTWGSSLTQADILYPNLFLGSGGGSGACSNSSGGGTSVSGAGGRGGGALIIEVNGTLTFTTANGISVAGKDGGAGTLNGIGASSDAQGGGGGSGGYFLMFYNILGSSSGTVNISGGNGGTGAGNGGAPAGSFVNAAGGGGGGTPIAAGSASAAGSTSAVSGGNGATGYSLIAQNLIRF